MNPITTRLTSTAPSACCRPVFADAQRRRMHQGGAGLERRDAVDNCQSRSGCRDSRAYVGAAALITCAPSHTADEPNGVAWPTVSAMKSGASRH